MAPWQMHAQGRTSTVVSVVAVSCLAAALLYSVQQKRNRRKWLKLSLEKPQTRFKKVLADNSRAPFQHLHSLDGDVHPYSQQIRALLEDPPRTLVHREFKKRPPDLDGPCEWIDSRSQLEGLASILSHVAEFAVDTEQHSVHSFLGFTALIQISTFTHDYLVDTIALHDYMDILQPVFANAQICKVFHGADSDNLWLQRDFHIYIVNLFDTARACDVLGKPQRSLAYLLHEYCNVTTNKVFQRADWRQRPLPEAMLHYARVDTHYLLYIAHCLQDELSSKGEVHEHSKDTVEENAFVQVVLRSNALCLQLYDKDGASTSPQSAAFSLTLRYHNSRLPGQKISSEEEDIVRKLIKLLCEWRDNIARLEDENIQSVLSNLAILGLVKCRPTSPEAILHALSSAGSASSILSGPVGRNHVKSLWAFIKQTAPESGSPCRQKVGQQELISHHSLRSSWITTILSAIYGGQRRDVGTDHDFEGYSSIKFVADTPQLVAENCLTAKDSNMKNRLNQGNRLNSRAQFVKKFSCKAPVYHNCRIYAGDGRLLCYCDRKKLEWYVNRGLAEFIDENPPAVKLLFEPKGRPEDENNEFYILSKTNRCVGCGENGHYLRYRVIPSCYRQHFPEYLKSHRSHDIVLLCVDCHEIAHRAAERHKREIATEFGVPLFPPRVGKTVRGGVEDEGGTVAVGIAKDISPMGLRNAAMALLRHGETLPSGRREELEAVVKAYYGGKSFSSEEFQMALISSVGPREQRRLLRVKGSQVPQNFMECNATISYVEESLGCSQMSPSENEENAQKLVPSAVPSESLHLTVNSQDADPTNGSLAEGGDFNQTLRRLSKAQKDSLLGHGPHGRKVVEILLRQGGDDAIRAFNQRWRSVFVHALHPAFLPPGWDIHHSGRREFGDHSVYKPR